MAKLKARYVDALLELAEENANLEQDLEQALLLRDSLSDQDVLKFLMHPHVPDQDKQQLFAEVFADKLAEYLLGFLYLMIRKNREALIVPILNDFIIGVKRRLGIVTAKVVSAKPLTEQQIDALKKVLARQLEMQVELDLSVNPNVLGGFYIEVDGWIFDGTIRSRLNNIKYRLKREIYDAS